MLLLIRWIQDSQFYLLAALEELCFFDNFNLFVKLKIKGLGVPNWKVLESHLLYEKNAIRNNLY